MPDIIYRGETSRDENGKEGIICGIRSDRYNKVDTREFVKCFNEIDITLMTLL